MRVSVLAIAVVVLTWLVLSSSAAAGGTASSNAGIESPPGSETPDPGVPPGTYTYEEAMKLGIDVGPTPETTGLPLCPYEPDWGGIAPDESLPKEDLEAPATCVADRSYLSFGVGYPAPHAGYHHSGYRTANPDVAGAQIEVEIRNSEVDHGDPGNEFVANRVLTVNSASDDWIEVGYAEASWESDGGPRVYAYRTVTNQWVWFGQYGLSTGNYLAAHTRNCSISGNDFQCAEIYWSGQWQLLYYSAQADCRGNAGNPRCYAEEQTEPYSNQSSFHPDLAGVGANRIDWRDSFLRKDIDGTAQWVRWEGASDKAQQLPYQPCAINYYYRFYVIKGGSC